MTRSSRRRRAAQALQRFVWAIVALAAAPATAAKASQDTASAPARVRVVVVVDAPDDAAAALETSLRQVLGRRPYELTVVRADASAPAASPGEVRAFVSAPEGDDARIRLVAANQAVERRVPRDGPPDVVREEIAQVADSLVDGALSAPPPPPPPPSPQPPGDATPRAATPDPRGGVAVDLGAFAALRAFGAGATTFGAGGALQVSARRGAGAFGVALSGAVHAPFESTTPAVDLHTTVTSARIVPTVVALASSRFLLDVGAGAGIDVIHAAPHDGRLPVAHLEEAQTDIAIPLTALTTLHARIAVDADLVVGLGADLDLAPRRYAVRDPSGGTSAVFATWRVRPYLLAGISFALAGGARYAAPSPKEPSP